MKIKDLIRILNQEDPDLECFLGNNGPFVQRIFSVKVKGIAHKHLPNSSIVEDLTNSVLVLGSNL